MANKTKYDNPFIIQHRTDIKVVHKLDELASKKNISRTQLVNDIIEEYFNKLKTN